MGRGESSIEFEEIERSSLDALLRRPAAGLLAEANRAGVHHLIFEPDREQLIADLFGDPDTREALSEVSEAERRTIDGLFTDIALHALIGSSHTDKLQTFFHRLYLAAGVEECMTFCLAWDASDTSYHLAEADRDNEHALCGIPLGAHGFIRPVVIPRAVSPADRRSICEACEQTARSGKEEFLSPAVLSILNDQDGNPQQAMQAVIDRGTYYRAMEAAPQAAFEMISHACSSEPAGALFERVECAAADAYLQESVDGVAFAVRSLADSCPKQLFLFGIPSDSPEYQTLTALWQAVKASPQTAENFRDWLAETIEEGGLLRASEKGKFAAVTRARWLLVAETLHSHDQQFFGSYRSALQERELSSLSRGEQLFVSFGQATGE